MVRAWLKRQKIKVEVEKQISDWHLKNKWGDPENFAAEMSLMVKEELTREIFSRMTIEIDQKVKERIIDSFIDDDLVKEALRQQIRERLIDSFRF